MSNPRRCGNCCFMAGDYGQRARRLCLNTFSAHLFELRHQDVDSCDEFAVTAADVNQISVEREKP